MNDQQFKDVLHVLRIIMAATIVTAMFTCVEGVRAAELPMKIDTTWHYEPFVPLMDIYFVWDFCSKELARKSLENHCFEFALYLDTSDIYYTTDTSYWLTEEQVRYLGIYEAALRTKPLGSRVVVTAVGPWGPFKILTDDDIIIDTTSWIFHNQTKTPDHE